MKSVSKINLYEEGQLAQTWHRPVRSDNFRMHRFIDRANAWLSESYEDREYVIHFTDGTTKEVGGFNLTDSIGLVGYV